MFESSETWYRKCLPRQILITRTLFSRVPLSLSDCVGGCRRGFSLVMARDQICRGSRSKGDDAKSYENADCRFYRDICPRIVDGTGIVLLSRNEQWARPDVLDWKITATMMKRTAIAIR